MNPLRKERSVIMSRVRNAWKAGWILLVALTLIVPLGADAAAPAQLKVGLMVGLTGAAASPPTHGRPKQGGQDAPHPVLPRQCRRGQDVRQGGDRSEHVRGAR